MESTRRTITLSILLLLLLIFTLFSSASAAAAACNKQDEKALLAFKKSFRYSSLDSWSKSTDCCSWDFISCDSASGRVTSLRFYNDYDMPEFVFLNGSIPAAIGDLSELERIWFNKISSLEGPIPPQMSKLKKLQSLQIYRTRVSGPIPASLGNLVNLTELFLYQNRLSGPIPDSLFSKLPKGTLASLTLSFNRLTGNIPKSFANVPFSYIHLDQNKLTGDALFLFGKSKPTAQINLASNKLAFNLSKVEFPVSAYSIDVSKNKIYGSLPNQITHMPGLRVFDVSYNKLCGSLPNHITHMPDLIAFDVSYNKLCGKIPTELAGLPPQNFAHNKCLCGAPLQPCK